MKYLYSGRSDSLRWDHRGLKMLLFRAYYTFCRSSSRVAFPRKVFVRTNNSLLYPLFRAVVAILLIFVRIPAIALAQDTLRLTLEEAIERGLAYSPALRNQQLAIDLADGALDKLKARKAPVVGAGADLRTNIVLPVTIIPGAAFSNQGQNEGDRKIRFGTTFNISGAVEVNYALLDPTLGADRQVAEAERTLQGTLFEAQRQQQKLIIAEAWYNVFLQQESARLADEKLRRAKVLQEINQIRETAGTALPADLLRNQLDVDNAAAAFEQTLNQLVLSRQTLAYRLGLPLNTTIGVADIPAPDMSLPEQVTPTTAQRWEIVEQQQRMALAELEVRQIEDRYKPGLDLYGNAAVQHLSNDFAVWNNWFPLVYAGVQTKIPVFDGQLKRREQEIARIQGLIARQNLERWQSDIAYETATAKTAMQNAVVQWKTAQGNLATATRLFELEKARYAGGKLLYSALVDAEYSLREAENNALTAWYDYLLAKVRWERATGRL
jgi:outer membrane protein